MFLFGFYALNPQLTITIGRAAFAVAGISTTAAGASAIILATGGAALLVGGGLYLATRNRKSDAPRESREINHGFVVQSRTLFDASR